MWQFFNRIQYLDEISEVWLLYKHICPEMVAEIIRDFGLNVSVCVCAYACVSRGQLWQPCWVCLCAPIPRRWQRVRGRKIRAHLTALFIYILRSFPSALQPLSASDTENSHIAVSKEASLFLCCLSWTHMPSAPIQYFMSFSRWSSEDKEDRGDTEWETIMKQGVKIKLKSYNRPACKLYTVLKLIVDFMAGWYRAERTEAVSSNKIPKITTAAPGRAKKPWTISLLCTVKS